MQKNNILFALVLLFFQVIVMGQGVNCADSEPFCTGPPYTYPAGTTGTAEPGAYYACLATQPAPAWFHMLIEDPGSITIYMYSTPLVDIDFICWGPFTNPVDPCVEGLTSGTIVDCSYSPNPTEYCDIPEGQTGQFYIMMITNYSQQPCEITFSQTAGQGSLDCDIISGLTPNFSGEPLEGPVPLNVQFTDETIGDPGSYMWDFQNDGVYDADDPNPSFTYTEPGAYSVKLRVENAVETDSIIYLDYISVLGPDIEVVPSSLTIYQSLLNHDRKLSGPLTDDTLTVFNTGTAALTVISITESAPWILISGFPEPPFDLGPDESQQVLVGIDWLLLGGELQSGTILINSSDPDEPLAVAVVMAIPFGMPPDLIIQDQNVDPETIGPGDSIFASCEISNQGNGDAGISYLSYYLSPDSTFDNNDLELGSDSTGILGDGQSVDHDEILAVPSNTTAGTWYILFFADADDQIEESEEDNNLAFIDFMVDTATWIPVPGSNTAAGTIKVYPNPARDRLFIDYSGMKDMPVEIEIFNSSGAIMHLSKNALVSPGMMSVNCGEWPAGSYVVRIKLTKDIIDTCVVIID